MVEKRPVGLSRHFPTPKASHLPVLWVRKSKEKTQDPETSVLETGVSGGMLGTLVEENRHWWGDGYSTIVILEQS